MSFGVRSVIVVVVGIVACGLASSLHLNHCPLAPLPIPFTRLPNKNKEFKWYDYKKKEVGKSAAIFIYFSHLFANFSSPERIR